MQISGNFPKTRDISVVLLFSYLPVLQFVTTVIDNTNIYMDVQGRQYWTFSSNYSLYLRYIYFLLILILVFIEFIQLLRAESTGFPSHSFSPSGLFFFLFVLCVQILNSVPYKDLLGTVCLGFFLILKSRDSFKLWHKLLQVYVVSALIIIGFIIVDWSSSWNACRGIKCGVFGNGLLKSFFGHENALGFYLAVGSFLIYCISQRFRKALIFFASILILATGSKISYIMLILSWGCSRRINLATPRLISFFPCIFLFISGVTFYLVSGSGLSGRGYIYDFVKNSFLQHPLLGQNRVKLQESFFNGQSNFNFLATHEHGQVPYILFQFGLIGLIIFVFVFLKLANFQKNTVLKISVIPLTVVSCGFATEELLTPSIFGWFAWTLVVYFGYSQTNLNNSEMAQFK